MKLSDAIHNSLLESRFFIVNEEGEAPTWTFPYSSWHHDRKPTILLLGAYTHPRTENQLVGGINLNYLNRRQRDQIASVLPQIMKSGNLYGRYHTGKKLLPQIFGEYYRTYLAQNIRGVETGTLYPKYGMLKAAQNYVKKNIGGLFKSKAQRAKETEPQYPSDLEGMKDMLDNVVVRLAKSQEQQPPDTPEMQAAQKAVRKHRMDRARTMADPETMGDQEPLDSMDQEPSFPVSPPAQPPALPQAPPRPQAPPKAQPPAQPQAPPKAPPQAPPKAPSKVQPAIQQQGPQELSPKQLGQMIQKDRIDNQKELLDPKNEIDLDVQESIRYYSPVAKCFIMETIGHGNRGNLLSKSLNNLRPQLAAAAQAVYDDWEDEGSGICDLISTAMGEVLSQFGIETTEGGHDGDDHSYIIAYDDTSSFLVDIDPYTYERGGGYNWVKLPDVVFGPADILIVPVERPDWVDDAKKRFG